MGKIILFIFTCLINLSAFSQSDSTIVGFNPFFLAETKPLFPGGEDSFFRYLDATIVYPFSAQDEGLEARLVIQFTIDSLGSVVDTEIVFSSINGDKNIVDSYGFGSELESAVLNSPRWKPAMRRDEPASIKMQFAYKFEL